MPGWDKGGFIPGWCMGGFHMTLSLYSIFDRTSVVNWSLNEGGWIPVNAQTFNHDYTV